MPHKRIRKQLYVQRKEETTMNYNNQRLKTIKELKTFYHKKLKEGNTELGEALIKAKIKELESEEKNILKQCDVII